MAGTPIGCIVDALRQFFLAVPIKLENRKFPSWKGIFMLQAIVSQGEIRPLEPLPEDWQDGQRLRIEKVDVEEASAEEIDRDFAVLEAMCEKNDPVDDELRERAILEARQQAKDQVRRQMGLE